MTHKQFLSIAVAAAMAAPLAAQAGVKLTGTIQGELGHVEVGGGDGFTTSTDSTGALGAGGGPNKVRFDVSEDLGGGLQAFGRADWGFNLTTSKNSSNLTDREKFVGIKSSSGAYLRFGRIQGAYKTATKIDPFYSTGAQMRCAGGESCGSGFTHSSFLDNIFEIGFKNSGFKLALQGILDESTDAAGDSLYNDGSFLADVEYGNDMFTVFGAYSQISTDDDPANWKVGGKFSMGGLTLGLQYEDAEMDTYNGGAALKSMGSMQGQFAAGSASYKIGNAILAGWVSQYMDDEEMKSDARTSGDTIGYSVGAIYLFGKNTIAYAAYHATDSDSKVGGNEDAYDWNAFAAGIRHSF